MRMRKASVPSKHRRERKLHSSCLRAITSSRRLDDGKQRGGTGPHCRSTRLVIDRWLNGRRYGLLSKARRRRDAQRVARGEQQRSGKQEFSHGSHGSRWHLAAAPWAPFFETGKYSLHSFLSANII